MERLEDRDFFTDPAILNDPYEYFEAVRARGPIYRPEGKDYLIVTGFAEALEIFRNSTDFSASIALQGAACPLTFKPEGSDISAQLEAHRSEIIGHDLLVNMDDEQHANLRALVNRLFVPSRLKANEDYMDELSEAMIRKVVTGGKCELMQELATPFVTAVVADLLGVPREDRDFFIKLHLNAPPPGSLNSSDNDYRTDAHPMIVMAGYFEKYIQDRIDNPRDDIMSELAHATYPDGTKPTLKELVNLSTFMFGAGQDTSAKLIGNAIRYIVDEPGLQARLREDPTLIPLMLEEVLRLEGSSKITARLTRKDTTVGGMDIPAGTRIGIALAALSRDPRRWDDPQSFILNRPRIKEHLSFGRGAHTCAGAPLARAEVRILMEKLFQYTAHIDLDEAEHGTPGNRRLQFDPSFIVRGLSSLQIKLTPSKAFTL
ncbi:MAG: cytochrome P450 [Sphingobium sp.]